MSRVVDFCIDAQMKRGMGEERHEDIILKRKDKVEKIFLLQMIYNTSKDSSDEQRRESDKHYNFELILTTVLISVTFALMPTLFLNFNYQTLISTVVVILILEFVIVFWSNLQVKKMNRSKGPLTFYGTGHLRNRFSKINEKWYVYISDSGEYSFTQFPSIYIETESERRMFKISSKKARIEIHNKVRDIENEYYIKQISKNKEKLIGKKIRLRGLLVRKSFTEINRKVGFNYEYILHDKTGKISVLDFFIKKHFWEKVPSSRKILPMKEGLYELNGVFTEHNGLYYIILLNSKPLKY